MQDFTDGANWNNIPRTQKIVTVGLVLIGCALVWFGPDIAFESQSASVGIDLMLFAGIYALTHELAGVKKRLRNVQQAINAENAQVVCHTALLNNRGEGGLSDPSTE